MRLISRYALILAVAGYSGAFAQSPTLPNVDVTITRLSNPVYPILARAARVTGDVDLRLEIRADGSVASASVIRGHPLLDDAALQSAQQSRFECRECGNGTTPYSLTYSFQLLASPDWPCPETRSDRVLASQNHITVVAEPRRMHIQFGSIRVRAARCLYLWHCGSRWGGEGYYYRHVTSRKCLYLWKCGHQLREPYATCKRLHRRMVD
jgi:TonB family protein